MARGRPGTSQAGAPIGMNRAARRMAAPRSMGWGLTGGVRLMGEGRAGGYFSSGTSLPWMTSLACIAANRIPMKTSRFHAF
jgi:hypothetical protein